MHNVGQHEKTMTADSRHGNENGGIASKATHGTLSGAPDISITELSSIDLSDRPDPFLNTDVINSCVWHLRAFWLR